MSNEFLANCINAVILLLIAVFAIVIGATSKRRKPVAESVVLHAAYGWKCADCGHEHFESHDFNADFGLGDVVILSRMPKQVQCGFCGSAYKTTLEPNHGNEGMDSV